MMKVCSKCGMGYVIGNIAVISDKANTIKSNGSWKEHLLVANWIDSALDPLRKDSFQDENTLSTRDGKITLLRKARKRAKDKNLDFDLEISDLHVPVSCPVLGIPLSPGVGKSHDGSPSIDRIDPTKGYTKRNTAVISHRANAIKSYGTAEEHRKIADWLKTMLLSSQKEDVCL